jgi:superfamily I DNA/RNA helicase
VHIMIMAGAKGLTVRAAIVAALEDGNVPLARPEVDLREERRLLYVAMTRATEYVYGTWAQTRRGATARAGTPRVGSRRSYSNFLEGGPVNTEGGDHFIEQRWS